MKEVWDVAVIGGGPAGMIAAGRAAELGARTVLLEKNSILGKKLLITGGGRCNILHAEFDHRSLLEKYGKKGKALFSCLSQFDVQDTWDFFESRGLKLKVEDEKRAFPVTDNAADVRRVLATYMAQGGVQIQENFVVKDFVRDGSLIKKIVHISGLIEAKKIIIATGGKSRPETGSTGDGFLWAKNFGHTVHEPDPALVPITVKNPWVKDVAGISFSDVRLSVFSQGKKEDSRIGKMLFTHDGLSGPLVLNMSKRIGELLKQGDVTVSLDLFPTLDHGALDERVMKVFDQAKNKMIKNWIGDLVPPRLGMILIPLAGIDPQTPLHQLTREHRKTFTQLLKSIPLTVNSLLGEDRAVVTGGGVDLKEIDFRTMKSKLIENLFFTGDILDFDRPSGGFSLQICWTTGFTAGTSAAQQALTCH